MRIIVASLLFLMVGCATYQIGSHSLYAPDVATVYVPMIESESFRRDLGERLTEAVMKEIELKTPFKVVGTPDADSVLSIRLHNDQRRVLFENAYDDPRAAEMEFNADVTWVNRRRQPLVSPQSVPLPPSLVPFGQTSVLIPESGQSIATAHQIAIQRLAEQIVGAMEEPW